jgi:DoxX-like family
LPLPTLFVRFIGICEVLGELGLVLPGVFRTRTDLTPLAAQGLVVIMVGAVVTTVASMAASMAILPLVVGILAAAVAYGRSRVAPLTARRSSRVALYAAG